MTATEQKFIKRLGLTTLVSGSALTLLLMFTSRGPLRTLAESKPGLWGEPTWYLLLLSAYGTAVLTVLSAGILITIGQQGRPLYRWYALALVTTVFVRGLLYSSIVPPWQSPDEHAHFEYAALLGQLKRVPSLDDVSPSLQKEIVQSMFKYDFWRLIKRRPVESPPEGFLPQQGVTRVPSTNVVDNRFLYYPQIEEDPPLYYIAPAIVYAACPRLDVALQLYVMRLSTVTMLVGLASAVTWSSRRLFPEDLLLAAAAPTLIAFHPMLTHIGSVLNNDILAAGIATLVLGVLVDSFHYGLGWRRAVILATLTILGMLTKISTLWIAPVLGSTALVLLCRRYRWIKLAMLIAAAGLVGLTSVLFIPSQQARHWRSSSHTMGATVTGGVSIEGAYALRVKGGINEEGVLEQQLLLQTVLDLRGQSVTLWAKARADSGQCQGKIAMSDVDSTLSVIEEFTAGPEWHDVVLHFSVPEDARRIRVQLTAEPGSVMYFDDVTLRVSSTAIDEPMIQVHNGSGEYRRTVGEIALVKLGEGLGRGGVIRRFFEFGPENLQRLLADPSPLRLGFQSFWGNFGAALAVPLPRSTYTSLAIACGLSLFGCGVYSCRIAAGRRALHSWQKDALTLLSGALLLVLLEVFAPLFALYGYWSPQGRYLFPAIWPIGVILTLGWSQLASGRPRPWLLVLMTVGIIMLDCVALRELIGYFYF